MHHLFSVVLFPDPFHQVHCSNVVQCQCQNTLDYTLAGQCFKYEVIYVLHFIANKIKMTTCGILMCSFFIFHLYETLDDSLINRYISWFNQNWPSNILSHPVYCQHYLVILDAHNIWQDVYNRSSCRPSQTAQKTLHRRSPEVNTIYYI